MSSPGALAAAFGRPRIGEQVSGDAAVIVTLGDDLFLAIVDVLGHGPQAHAVAVAAEQVLAHTAGADLCTTMSRLHEGLRGSLGAAVGLAHVDVAHARLSWLSVGNTALRCFGAAETRLVSRPGIIGRHLPVLREERLTLGERDLIVLTTDGVREHFSIDDYPGVLGDSPAFAARSVVERFGRDHDDATCIAMRYRP